MNDETKKADPPGQKCQVLKDGTTICKPIKPEVKKKEGKVIAGRGRIVIEFDDKGDERPKEEGGE